MKNLSLIKLGLENGNLRHPIAFVSYLPCLCICLIVVFRPFYFASLLFGSPCFYPLTVESLKINLKSRLFEIKGRKSCDDKLQDAQASTYQLFKYHIPLFVINIGRTTEDLPNDPANWPLGLDKILQQLLR